MNEKNAAFILVLVIIIYTEMNGIKVQVTSIITMMLSIITATRKPCKSIENDSNNW